MSNPTVRILCTSTQTARENACECVSHSKPLLRRVAVYCRVSTENESQESSLFNQTRFFHERISREAGWTLAGLYADKGITGTSTRNRTEFNRMLADCEAGMIDTVLTKGISRFARNTLDLLAIVRKLKALGINVIFDAQSLDTASEGSELLLTILGALAQEGSQSISDNVRWSNQKRYRMGDAPWSRIYGYRRDITTGEAFVPDGERAEAVRRIFNLYVDGASTLEIMRTMHREGWPAPSSSGVWYNKTICNILANEKYRGDALLQKSYVADLLTHRRVLNRGEKPGYYVEGHHTPLVSPEIFDRVQVIRRLRLTHGGALQYPYAERLICPCCGAYLRQTHIAAQGSRSAWFCMRCHGFGIRTCYLDAAVLEARRLLGDPPPKRVAYGWLDELTACIRFTERSILVHWRNARETEIDICYRYPREQPTHIAALLQKQFANDALWKKEGEV